MGRKYVKPVVRNLGEIIPDAYGNCKSGSAAGQACRNGATNDQPNCNPGSRANGACNNGGSALPACAAGTGVGISLP